MLYPVSEVWRPISFAAPPPHPRLTRQLPAVHLVRSETLPSVDAATGQQQTCAAGGDSSGSCTADGGSRKRLHMELRLQVPSPVPAHSPMRNVQPHACVMHACCFSADHADVSSSQISDLAGRQPAIMCADMVVLPNAVHGLGRHERHRAAAGMEFHCRAADRACASREASSHS